MLFGVFILFAEALIALVHRQGLLLEVDVRRCECQQLSLTNPRVVHGHEYRVAGGTVFHALDKCLELVLCPEQHFIGFLLTHAPCLVAWILFQSIVLDCVVENCRELVVDALEIGLGVGLGLISSILTLPLHELLHAICISSKNNVQIYRVKSGLMTWFTAPITKRRYLGMLLVPVLLLGFIPSICTFVIPETMPGFITFVLIFSLGNIGMSCGDLTNFIITAIKVKKGNKVLPCKNGIFKVQ